MVADGLDDRTLNRHAERAWQHLTAPVDYPRLFAVAGVSGLAAVLGIMLGALLLRPSAPHPALATASPPIPSPAPSATPTPVAASAAIPLAPTGLKPGDCRDFTTTVKSPTGENVVATGRVCMQADGQVALVGTPGDVPMGAK